MKYASLWGPITADTTPETVFTNVTGTVAIIDSITMANPASAAATNVILSVGSDGATTREIVYPMPAGPFTAIIYPGITVTGTTILQLSSSATDDVCVTSGNGRVIAV
jgi:hypothetical protein